MVGFKLTVVALEQLLIKVLDLAPSRLETPLGGMLDLKNMTIQHRLQQELSPLY